MHVSVKMDLLTYCINRSTVNASCFIQLVSHYCIQDSILPRFSCHLLYDFVSLLYYVTLLAEKPSYLFCSGVPLCCLWLWSSHIMNPHPELDEVFLYFWWKNQLVLLTFCRCFLTESEVESLKFAGSELRWGGSSFWTTKSWSWGVERLSFHLSAMIGTSFKLWLKFDYNEFLGNHYNVIVLVVVSRRGLSCQLSTPLKKLPDRKRVINWKFLTTIFKWLLLEFIAAMKCSLAANFMKMLLRG